jgi:hypothetical protein
MMKIKVERMIWHRESTHDTQDGKRVHRFGGAAALHIHAVHSNVALRRAATAAARDWAEIRNAAH